MCIVYIYIPFHKTKTFVIYVPCFYHFGTSSKALGSLILKPFLLSVIVIVSIIKQPEPIRHTKRNKMKHSLYGE